MVRRAHATSAGLHINLLETLRLSVARSLRDKRDGDDLQQLRDEGWIRPAPDGGWFLD